MVQNMRRITTANARHGIKKTTMVRNDPMSAPYMGSMIARAQ